MLPMQLAAIIYSSEHVSTSTSDKQTDLAGCAICVRHSWRHNHPPRHPLARSVTGHLRPSSCPNPIRRAVLGSQEDDKSVWRGL